VEGADVTVYRVKDPIAGDDRALFDHGVLDAPVATPEVVLQADCIVLGAPGRQGRVCAEMSFFLDSLRDFQNNGCLLKGKVGSAFTSVGEVGSGHGGHEGILQSFHSFFLQHGMLPVGVPPSPMMDAAPLATPLGTCMSGSGAAKETPGSRLRSLSEEEVKLAYSQGEWASIITKQLHDDGD
jgi:NAD(P)H dehydrogenase (quinone)